MIERSVQYLEVDEKLTRYWLSCILCVEKRVELEEHLESILSEKSQLLAHPQTSAQIEHA